MRYVKNKTLFLVGLRKTADVFCQTAVMFKKDTGISFACLLVINLFNTVTEFLGV